MREWTQNELAKRSGVDRGALASIETGKAKNPTTINLLKLARAFNIRPEELYQAAGYIKEAEVSYPYQQQMTSGQIVEQLTLTLPVSIPVYAVYPFDPGKWTEPIAYIHRDRDKAKKSLEGYLIHGGMSLLDPVIIDGDIIIMDKEGEIHNGDIIICLFENKLQLGKFRKIADEPWLENNFGRIKFEECQAAAPVIEVIRRLK